MDDGAIQVERLGADVAGAPLHGDTAAGLIGETLRTVLDAGHRAGGTRELLHRQLVLAHPRARTVVSPHSSFNPIVAVARVIWSIAGSERLADIEVYEPRAGRYSDDGLSVPGSSFGARLRDDSRGVDQLAAAIERLREEPETRRAAAVVWRAEDAARASVDIPCAFGSFFHVRDGALVAATAMRSNNALRLLPYNLFEFTMLAEIVACEVGVALGPYVHTAVSLHVFDGELERARELAESLASAPPPPPMEPMPATGSPLAAARTVARLEARLQRDVRKLAGAGADELLDEGRAALDAYWLGVYLVLVGHLLARAGRRDAALELVPAMPEGLRRQVAERLAA